MFEFWDWVGGRYSMDSAIGLSTMIAIGAENFRAMLAGFHADGRALPHRAVRTQSAGADGPAGVWYNNFFGAETVAVLPYEQYLKRFPAYLAAVDHGEQRQACHARRHAGDYQTGPIYWGEPGTNGQHSFYQLIHQGTQLIPCDFIGFAQTLNPLGGTTIC